MRNLLSKPYCQFDPAEWTEQTGVPSAKDTAEDGFPSTVLDCPFKSESCPVHGSIAGQTAAYAAEKLLNYFGESPPEKVDKRKYYAISGVEVAGFDLQGQTLFAKQAQEIDLRHLIVHGEFNVAGGAIANRLSVGNSLFHGRIIANRAQIDERLSLNYSRIEGDVSFENAELRGGFEAQDATIEGDLSFGTATLSEDLDLSGAEIKGDLDLSQTRIQGGVNLSDTTIEGNCTFRESQIRGRIQAPRLRSETINLDHTTVSGHILFKDITATQIDGKAASIEGTFNLDSSEIRESVRCKMVNIDGGARIRELDTGGDVILRGGQLNHRSQIWKSDIGGKLNLSRMDCSHHFYILSSEIQGDLEFAAGELGSFTQITDVTVNGDLSGDATNATGVILFKGLTVKGDANLRDLSIEEHLRVADSRITGDCNLAASRTTEQTRFINTHIGGEIRAHDTTIGQRLYISGSRVCGPITLTASQAATIEITPDSVIGGLNLEGARITDQPLDIKDIRIRGDLILDDAVIERDMHIDDVTTQAVSMGNCSINGQLTATNLCVGYPAGSGSFEADQLIVKGDVDLKGAQIGKNLRLSRARVEGDLTLDTSWIEGELRLGNSHLFGEVVATNVYWGDIRLDGTTLEDDLLFYRAHLSGGITAYQLTSNGDTVNIVRSSIPGGVNIEHAEFSGDFVLTKSSTEIEQLPSWSSRTNTQTAVQARGVNVKGELLFESSLIYGEVDISKAAIEGQLRITNEEDDHSTSIDGNLKLEESIIEEQLILNSVHPKDSVLATDIRVGSKTLIEDVTAKELDFSQAFFKWNVNIDDVYARNLNLTNSTLQNRLTITKTVVSNGRLILREAQINNAEVNRGYSRLQIDCTESTIKDLNVNRFDESTIWDDIRVEKTRFDGFDFTGFTSALHSIKHRIHHNRDTEPFYQRFINFWSTLFTRSKKSINFESSPIPTRNLETMQEIRDGHLDREITYRRAKDSADTTSDNTAASEFYRLEKKHRRRRRFWEIIGGGGRKLSNIGSYVANLLLGAVSGHGERITRVVLSAGVFLLMFTFLYLGAPQFENFATSGETFSGSTSIDTKSVIEYVFLSIASFTNIPNTIPETASQSIRFISYIERFIGAAYIPLLVFTLTRSLHR